MLNKSYEMEFLQKEPLFGSYSSILLLVSSCVGLFSSLISFIYMTLFLKLNNFIKIALQFHSFIQILCNLVMIIGHIVMGIQNFQTRYSCGFIITPVWTMVVSAIYVSMTVSILRYYMSWKASKTQIGNATHFRVLIVVSGLMGPAIMTIDTYYHRYMDSPTLINACAEVSDVGKRRYIAYDIYIIIVLAFPMFLTLGLNKMLIKFVEAKKKADQNTEDSLVPWKVPGSEEEQLKNTNIPIRAVYLSSISLVIVLLFLAILVATLEASSLSSGNDFDLKYISVILTLNWTSCHLPCILIFTVKHNTKIGTIAKTQPPRQLQFHDEDINVPKISIISKRNFYEQQLEILDISENSFHEFDEPRRLSDSEEEM